MEAIIYKITNDINDKIYVGQTSKTIEERFARHCAEARWKNVKRMPIVLAIRKYGKEHFKIEMLEKVSDCTQFDVDNREIFWSAELNTMSPWGYNLKVGKSCGKLSEESKRKISASNKGRKVKPETIERLRVSHLGYKVKDSTKKKLSEFNKGKVLSEEHKKKIAASNTGRKTTDTAKEKMRAKKLKFFYKITAPDGKLFETHNLREFCRDNKLNVAHMNGLSNGKKPYYKGWQVVKI